MPLITKVGRRSWRARLAIGLVYLALTLGASTTLYPLLVMLSTSVKSAADQNDNLLIPAYYSKFESKEQGKLDDNSLTGKFLVDKYAGDVNAIGSSRIGADATNETQIAYERFLMSLPPTDWVCGFKTASGQVTGRLANRYHHWLRGRYSSIEDLNRVYVEENPSFQSVNPPIELLEKETWRPSEDPKWVDFLEFKNTLGPEFRHPIRSQRLFQEFLRSKTKNQFSEVDPSVVGQAKKFEELQLPNAGPLRDEFWKTKLPARYRKETIEQRWQKIAPGPMPIASWERSWLAAHQSEVRREFTFRNYAFVLDYILTNGRVLLNTLLFCCLAILTQLTVNPLAAYALSRYPMPATGRILLFLLATMAFPSEVAMIPSFLLLKDLGLLNTFAALVLPGAASGYMIFILKGFFDSLPRELYEAGQIDGAKESTLMLRIALPLSRPVLGYLALLAFMGSYGAFLYAFLVAQDRRIWTLMVWIYQLQASAPKSVMMAALAVAMIPTLTVFLLAQRVIMKGIVLPDSR